MNKRIVVIFVCLVVISGIIGAITYLMWNRSSVVDENEETQNEITNVVESVKDDSIDYAITSYGV